MCAALDSDPAVTHLACAPGNPGIGQIAELHQVNVVSPISVAELARRIEADLVVIGPEQPLVAGVADAVRAAGIACFGPSQAAARLEGSKSFAKHVMVEAGVPTAASRSCESMAEATQALGEFGPPYVVKDDALAAGKGVVVTSDRDMALNHAMACNRVVIEQYLDGPEVSLFVITDGESALPLLPVQDFKRVGDGDTGPNTGGMGAYCPLPWAPAELTDHVMESVVHPTLKQLRSAGTPFAGLLYVGLALTSTGPKVIEFNARFGDPETQAVLPLLKTPLAGVLFAAAAGSLANHPPLEWASGSAVTVVMASANYPEAPRLGDTILGLDDVPSETPVFHAGTTKGDDGALLTAGGRVLAVTGLGKDLAEARGVSYAGVERIVFDGEHHRNDIATKALNGEIVTQLAASGAKR